MKTPSPSPIVLLAAMISLTAPTTHAANDSVWSDFDGPRDDFTVSSRIEPWGAGSPKRLWQHPLGPGYSGIVGDESQVITMYRELGAGEGAAAHENASDVVVSVDSASGETQWTSSYPAPTYDVNMLEFGSGPHATPLLLNDRVITLGYTGIVSAFDRTSGKNLWQHDLVELLDAEVTNWGFSASPILHGDLILILAGGFQGVIAFDESGEIRWKSEAGSASYTTPRIIDVDGSKQLIFFAKDALRSIDPDTGKTLWSHEIRNGYDNHASNLLWNGELLWVASQGESIGRVLRPRANSAETVWTNSKVRIHYWNAILIDGVVYAGLGDSGQIFSAVDLETGEILWRDRRLGLVQLLHSPSGTLVLSEDGELALVGLSRQGLDVKATAKIADELTRTVPTLIGNRLFVRDQSKLQAFDLSP